MYSIKSYTSCLNELPISVSTRLFDSLVRPILTYNCEIWNMDIYKSFYNASCRAEANKVELNELDFIDKRPYDKIHNRFSKFVLGVKKCTSNLASRSELGRYPIDCFIKTQSLLYEDRL